MCPCDEVDTCPSRVSLASPSDISCMPPGKEKQVKKEDWWMAGNIWTTKLSNLTLWHFYKSSSFRRQLRRWPAGGSKASLQEQAAAQCQTCRGRSETPAQQQVESQTDLTHVSASLTTSQSVNLRLVCLLLVLGLKHPKNKTQTRPVDSALTHLLLTRCTFSVCCAFSVWRSEFRAKCILHQTVINTNKQLSARKQSVNKELVWPFLSLHIIVACFYLPAF